MKTRRFRLHSPYVKRVSNFSPLQVKEFMLDGGRPQLTPSELLYPVNMLDLMVVAWSQMPIDRPSSSQIVRKMCDIAPDAKNL